ncbi:MAG: aquaporin [Candidatus Omnitrophica bacterium]|nr:aquaporin [Candidatus Omnitrophota bacterium]
MEFRKEENMNKYIVEFIGTFFLLLVIGLCVIEPGGAGAMAPLAIGTILMVMVYAGGHISGGHYNPAVTLGVWMRGKCEAKEVPFYMVAQVLGALAASLLVVYLKGDSLIVAANPKIANVFIAELIFTFALVFVVLNVATAKKTTGNSYYGLAIGFTLMTAAYSIGSISGCAINPAVAIGITLMGLSKLSNLWVFLVANFAGGALASMVFKITNSDE